MEPTTTVSTWRTFYHKMKQNEGIGRLIMIGFEFALSCFFPTEMVRSCINIYFDHKETLTISKPIAQPKTKTSDLIDLPPEVDPSADRCSEAVRSTNHVCGKKLPCAHRCSEGAGTNHVCVCNRKWTFDPGCTHKVTVTCWNYSKLGQPCLEPCRKVLDCGHPCLEPCSSDACICHLCFDKHSVVTPYSDGFDQFETEKPSATTEILAYPTLKLVSLSPKVSSAWDRNVTYRKVPQKAATNENPFLGLLNGFDKNEPCSSMMAYGNTNGPCTSKMAYGNTNGPDAFDLAVGPEATVNEVPDKMYIDLVDDYAWKLGYAKCLNAHYFQGHLRKCDTCGEKAEFQLPDGYYSDSDSD